MRTAVARWTATVEQSFGQPENAKMVLEPFWPAQGLHMSYRNTEISQEWSVVFSPEALDQLVELYNYIAAAASPQVAQSYTDAVVTYCESLQTFPQRGIRRDDVRSALRVTNYQSRTIIAFTADAGLVSIVGVFHGGQDYETALQVDN